MKKITASICTILLISCTINKNDLTKIEANKIQNFGKAKVGDTILMNYEIINKTDNLLHIKNIKTSCGCTLVEISDSIVYKNSSTKLKAKYIAEINDIGPVEKSIIIEANTDPVFTVFYLKGIVAK